MPEQSRDSLFERIEGIPAVQIIRSGLVMMIPILLLGSFSLLLRSLPAEGYQDFIQSFWSGALYQGLSLIYDGTFGVLSIYMVLALSISCAQFDEDLHMEVDYGAVLTSLACFVLSSGFLTEGFDNQVFGVKGMFLAIFSALTASWLYRKLVGKERKRPFFFSDGADAGFNSAVNTIGPTALVILVFVGANLLIAHLWGFSGLQEMFVWMAEAVFHGMGRNLGSGLLFVLFSSSLWFVGIHGSDVLDNVSQSLFAEGIQVNAALAAAGQQPTEIVTKTFFDVFVLMGGCGSTLCLLLALILFSRQRSNLGLAKMAAVPMLFNINEMMVFGLPVVFNPVLLVPFLLTPLVCTITSYLALYFHLVPIPITTIEWTTPVLWGGYAATGSLAGTLLQAVNLTIGTAIYRPFVLRYDQERQNSAKRCTDQLQRILMEGERNNLPVALLRIPGQCGKIAKTLSADLQHAIEAKEPYFLYQPQFDNKQRCIGAEALLRWNHILVGRVYPPLIIALADESDQLMKLEQYVLRRTLADLPLINERVSPGFRVCINVTAKNIIKEEFLVFLREVSPLLEPVKDRIEVSLEVTEQSALLSDHLDEHFQRIREMGFSLGIDDFSMGFTSLKYLQRSQFSLVKLDGSLVRDLIRNRRNQEIISSIVHLSHSLDFAVLAEYVETEEQQSALEDVGCLQYQGYLCSPPVPLEEMLELNHRLNSRENCG